MLYIIYARSSTIKSIIYPRHAPRHHGYCQQGNLMYELPDGHVGIATGAAEIVMTLMNSNEQSPEDVGCTRIIYMQSTSRLTHSPGTVLTPVQPSLQHLQT